MNTPKEWIGWLLCNTLCLAYETRVLSMSVHSDTGSDIIYFCLYQQNKILLFLENYVKCLVEISKCI